MNEIDIRDNDTVVTVLQALQVEMTADLDKLEGQIRAFPEEISLHPEHASHELDELRCARTAIYSGLESIREVLHWLEWITETDPEGETSVAAQPLPTMLEISIH